MRKVKLLIIHWLDHYEVEGWNPKEVITTLKGGEQCTSVGFLVKQNKEIIVLAQSISSECYGDMVVIVKAAIISMEQIGVMEFE